MSSSVDKPSSAPAKPSRRDATASRLALLTAATSLFEDRGYEATTVRDIGERAGVDPALIARYFGGKEGLYLASVAAAGGGKPPEDAAEVLERMVRKSATRGLSPIGLAMVSTTLSDTISDQVQAIIAERAVDPLARQLADAGVPQARLRAELVVALALGVSLTRAAGRLPEVRAATPDELVELLRPVVDRLCAGGPDASDGG